RQLGNAPSRLLISVLWISNCTTTHVFYHLPAGLCYTLSLLITFRKVGHMPSASAQVKALREGVEWFHTLADSAPVLVWASGPDGLCIYFNQRWQEFTGRTLQELVGNGWADDVHPDDKDRVFQEYLQAFHRHEKFRLEYRLRRSTGRFHWIVDFGAPVFHT